MFLSSVQPGPRQQDKFDKPRQSSPQGGRLQRYPHHKPGEELCSDLLLLTLPASSRASSITARRSGLPQQRASKSPGRTREVEEVLNFA